MMGTEKLNRHFVGTALMSVLLSLLLALTPVLAVAEPANGGNASADAAEAAPAEDDAAEAAEDVSADAASAVSPQPSRLSPPTLRRQSRQRNPLPLPLPLPTQSHRHQRLKSSSRQLSHPRTLRRPRCLPPSLITATSPKVTRALYLQRGGKRKAAPVSSLLIFHQVW